MAFSTTKARLLVEACSKSSPYSHTCKGTVGHTQETLSGKHAWMQEQTQASGAPGSSDQACILT